MHILLCRKDTTFFVFYIFVLITFQTCFKSIIKCQALRFNNLEAYVALGVNTPPRMLLSFHIFINTAKSPSPDTIYPSDRRPSYISCIALTAISTSTLPLIDPCFIQRYAVFDEISSFKTTVYPIILNIV